MIGDSLPDLSARDPNRLLGLELIRFVSAFAILVWHYQHFAYTGEHLVVGFVREQQPFYDQLRFFYDSGNFAVQVFWGVSGFIFFWNYAEKITRRTVGASSFFVLRFSRLYPLHLATLLLVALLQPLYSALQKAPFVYQHNDWEHFLYQLCFASEWGFQKGASFNGPIWSVSLEVLVYALFFVTTRWLGVSLLVNALVLAICLLATSNGVSLSIIECIALFYAGGLSALLLRREQVARPYTRVLMILLSLLIAVAALPLLPVGEERGAIPLEAFLVFVGLVLFWAGRFIALPASVGRVVAVAGNMTYASYLLHFPMQLALVVLVTALGWSLPIYEPTFFLGYCVSVFAVSALVYYRFEMPMQRLVRARWLRSGGAEGQPLAAPSTPAS